MDELFESEDLKLTANDHQSRDASRLSPYQDVAFMMWEELTSKMACPQDDKYASILKELQRSSAVGEASIFYQHGDMYRSRTENLTLNSDR